VLTIYQSYKLIEWFWLRFKGSDKKLLYISTGEARQTARERIRIRWSLKLYIYIYTHTDIVVTSRLTGSMTSLHCRRVTWRHLNTVTSRNNTKTHLSRVCYYGNQVRNVSHTHCTSTLIPIGLHKKQQNSSPTVGRQYSDTQATCLVESMRQMQAVYSDNTTHITAQCTCTLDVTAFSTVFIQVTRIRCTTI
jgi:hypothetical protein